MRKSSKQLKRILLPAFILLVICWIVYFFSGLSKVPFHPDESTQIFMSSDLESLISDPDTVYYDSSYTEDRRQIYRLIDAPLTRYAIEVGFWITSTPTLSKDWDWSESWQNNLISLPTTIQLTIARMSVAIFFPASIFLFFLITSRLIEKPYNYLAVIMFMMNAVVLLHTRRAMAESLLLFFMLLSIVSLLYLPRKHLFLSAIPIGLAINAKQSLAFLALVSIISVILFNTPRKKGVVIRNIFLHCIILISLFYILNPVMWQEPLKVSLIMFNERTGLVANQISDIHAVSPDFILQTPWQRFLGYFAQTFITPPAIQDVANYAADLATVSSSYLQMPFHSGYFRHLIPGTFLFFLHIFGLIKLLQSRSKIHRFFVFLYLLSLFEIIAIFPIPFQRYYLPLYPFVSILYAAGLAFVYEKAVLAIKNSSKYFRKA